MSDILSRLTAAGLRHTRQRMAIADLLLAEGRDQHVTAEEVAARLKDKGDVMALATVYNTLNTFVEAGLLRRINGAGDTAVFDTNIGAHHHFLDETTGTLVDIPEGQIDLARLPDLPEGREIAGVDVVIRLR